MNFQFLLSCRLVYNEAATIGFNSVGINLNYNQDTDQIDTRRLRELPISWRNAFTTASYESPQLARASHTPLHDPNFMFQKAHPAGIFPVHAVASGYWSYWSARRFLEDTYDLVEFRDPDSASAEQYVSFGAFLDNPRLQTWRIVGPRGPPGVLAERVNAKGHLIHNSAMETLQHPTSTRLQEGKWLRGLQVTFEEGDRNEYSWFVVLIRHKETPGVQARVRFTETWT